jgi:hypothetical protein
VALSSQHRQPRSAASDLPKLAALVAVGTVIVITLWQLHPNLLLTNSTTTGGDTGAHVALPAFLKASLLPWHLTGWYPGWYNGFPLYTYYFVLPDLFAALVSYVLPYNLAFKLATILGSVLLPICAYALGKLFRLRAPLPSALALVTLPFLFDTSFTIDGGNLFSTLAGEYAFSLSLALSLLVVGLFARGLRSGRGGVITPIVMALCLASHMIPYLFALLAAAFLTLLSLLPARFFGRDDTVSPEIHRTGREGPSWRSSLWWSLRTALLGVGLSAFWLLPFVVGQRYANPMGYTNDTNYLAKLFPRADFWIVALAAIGAVWGISRLSRFAITMTASAVAWGLTFRFLPQGSLWNERLIPLWYISLYLMAGWTAGAAALSLASWWRRRRIERYVAHWIEDPSTPRPSIPSWAPGAVAGPILLALLALVVVVPPLVPSVVPPSALRSLGVTVGANQVSSWATWNYSGYEAKPSYPEYKAVINTMRTVSARYGCGRAMWEYDASLDRFGTPMALMLLPYWTKNCVGSQEGLFFEASATTPYHFLIQAEVSAAPSDPQVGLPYGSTDVALGVEQLQLLGVRYLMTSSTGVTSQANADPQLTKVASTGPWPAGAGSSTPTTWSIYLIRAAPAVVALTKLPVVVPRIDVTSASWLAANVAWFKHPLRWSVPLAASGPPSWPRGSVTTTESRSIVPTTVSHVKLGISSLSFDVAALGRPVLVRESYYPRWHASGAQGPYRVSPNFMVVVPTAHHVILEYGSDPALKLGSVMSALALGGLVALVLVELARRRGRLSRRWRRS